MRYLEYLKNMKMCNKIEIGDYFIINWKKITNIYESVRPCNFQNREYVIHSFSKSMLSVYYLNEKTNRKCKCDRCRNPSTIQCMGISYIIITNTRKVIERDNKIKLILK